MGIHNATPDPTVRGTQGLALSFEKGVIENETSRSPKPLSPTLLKIWIEIRHHSANVAVAREVIGVSQEPVGRVARYAVHENRRDIDSMAGDELFRLTGLIVRAIVVGAQGDNAKPAQHQEACQ